MDLWYSELSLLSLNFTGFLREDELNMFDE